MNLLTVKFYTTDPHSVEMQALKAGALTRLDSAGNLPIYFKSIRVSERPVCGATEIEIFGRIVQCDPALSS